VTLLPSSILVGALWLIWGATFLVIKIGVAYTTPYVFVSLRVAVSAAVVGAIIALGRPRRTGSKIVHAYGAGLAFFNVAAYLPLQTAGISLSDVGFSAILIYTQPLLVAVFARRILRERLTPRQTTGLIVGWAGVATAALAGLDAGAAELLGIVLLLLAAAFWAAGSVLFKTVPPEIDMWRLLLWQNLYALPVVTAIAIVAGGETDWAPALVIMAALAGAGGGVGGFALLFTLLRQGQASVVSSWIFAVPIISSLLGVLVRGERLTAVLILGGAMVGAGIYLVTTRARQPVACR
jgi:drug/metabolite transporter (DMT)-like permease